MDPPSSSTLFYAIIAAGKISLRGTCGHRQDKTFIYLFSTNATIRVIAGQVFFIAGDILSEFFM